MKHVFKISVLRHFLLLEVTRSDKPIFRTKGLQWSVGNSKTWESAINKQSDKTCIKSQNVAAVQVISRNLEKSRYKMDLFLIRVLMGEKELKKTFWCSLFWRTKYTVLFGAGRIKAMLLAESLYIIPHLTYASTYKVIPIKLCQLYTLAGFLIN